MMKKAKSALISVFHKDGLEPIVRQLHKDGVKLYSTGGTQQYIESLKIPWRRLLRILRSSEAA